MKELKWGDLVPGDLMFVVRAPGEREPPRGVYTLLSVTGDRVLQMIWFTSHSLSTVTSYPHSQDDVTGRYSVLR